MSAHAKPAMDPFDPDAESPDSSSSESAANAVCQEVPIRTMGSRVITDSNGEILKGESFEEDSTTMLLLPRGAIIRLNAPVVRGQDLMLVNKRTNRYVHCRVKNLRSSPEVKNYVELEFTHTTSDFWGVTFPKDAMRAAGAIAAFAQRLPAQQPNPYGQPTRIVPATVIAAASAAFQSAAPAPALLKPEPPALDPPREAEPTPRETFFQPQSSLAVPLCEPVPEYADPIPAAPSEPVTAPPPSQLLHWEATSEPEPRRSRARLVAIGLAVLSAINLAYRLYAPAQAALTEIPAPTVLNNSDGARPAHPANSPAPLAPLGVVSAPAPEITITETPQQRVVLVSKMTAPVTSALGQPHEAPDLSAAQQKADPLAKAGGLALPPPPEPSPEPVKPVAVALTPAQLVSSVQPVYPPLARQAQIEGNVVVSTELDAEGNITGMKVVSGPVALRGAATAALAKWRFAPARLGDRGVASTTDVTIQFHLK